MTSSFSGDGTIPGGTPRRLITGNPTTVLQQGTMLLTNQNTPSITTTTTTTTTDLLIGKRSFSDFQSSHQHNIINNNYNNFSQQQNQQFHLQQQKQQQYMLMRSLRQKTTSFVSSPSSTQQQPILSFLNNNNNNNNNYSTNFKSLNNSTNSCNVNKVNVGLFDPGLTPTQYPNSISGSGFSSLTQNPVQPDPNVETNKIMNTLRELEKELLNDDDDDNNENTNFSESDPVSGITNSEWSQTFQNLIEPGLNPNPVHNMSNNSGTSNITTDSKNSINNNCMISSSPTSSTSSCCSTSAIPQLPITQLITEAAVAISDGKLEVGKEILTQLLKMVNQRGSAEQRLGFYMAHALQTRAWPNKNPASVINVHGKEQVLSDYLLHEISPCFKFGLLTANLVLLDAIKIGVHDKKSIHLIDFHVGHAAGGQYLSLLRALGERGSHARVTLKITLVVTEVDNSKGNNQCGGSETVGNSLMGLAEKMGFDLEFKIVTRRIAELTRESLSCEDSELVLVNFAFWAYRVPDESVSVVNLRDELLRRVKRLSPRAVTLVEQEMNANTASFVNRVNESCGYYGALFDSLELTRDDSDRVRVEEGLGRKLGNAVACEGSERVERTEVFGKWRARMGMAGFELKPLSQIVAESIRVKLDSVRGGNPGFTVKEENGGLSFGWKGKTIIVASAWR